MQPISAPELASIRTDLVSAVCDTPCTIKHVAVSIGTYGETIETEGNGIDMMAGLETPSSGLLTISAEQIAAQATWIVHFPFGTDVRANSNVYFGARKLKVQKVLTLDANAFFTDILAAEVA
jgi:hypothetical protein